MLLATALTLLSAYWAGLVVYGLFFGTKTEMCEFPRFLPLQLLRHLSVFESCSLNLFTSLCLFVGFTLPLFFIEKRKKTKHIAYVPHLVSAVVAEYEHGTNSTVLDSTVRQRIMRLAALPIPDYDHLSLIDGSEIVIKFLVSRSASFSSIPGLLRV